MRDLRPFTLAAIASTAVACVSEPRGSSPPGARDTLPNGAVVVRYDRLHDPRAAPLEPDLTIGVAEGDPNLVFGDIRSVEAGRDGTIYVLDYQASEVRAFDAQGRFLRKLTSKGAGPAELTRANGMILVGDSALWIQDHGKWMMIAVDRNGVELTRITMHVRSYGYVWDGTIDHRGRFWKPVTHPDEVRQYPPKEGLNETRARDYLKSYDPRTTLSDSIYLGERVVRSVVTRNNRGGYRYASIPYDPGTITVVDPAGGFWQAAGTAYRIARLDEHGDTTLVIDVAAEPTPVADHERRRYVDREVESSPGERRAAEQVAALMPEFKPAIAGLVTDDRERLWARRTVAQDGNVTYDVFHADGTYVGALSLGFGPAPSIPIRIRDGRVYAVVRDSLDVPSVARTGPLPSFLR